MRPWSWPRRIDRTNDLHQSRSIVRSSQPHPRTTGRPPRVGSPPSFEQGNRGQSANGCTSGEHESRGARCGRRASIHIAWLSDRRAPRGCPSCCHGRPATSRSEEVRSLPGWYAGNPPHPTSPRITGRRSQPCRGRRRATLLSGSSPRARCKGNRRYGSGHVHQRPPCARLTSSHCPS